MRCCLVSAVLVLLAAHNATAQQPPERLLDKPLVSSATAMARNARLTATLPAQGSRDSLKNGIVVGAVVGGILASAFGVYLCAALGEEDDPLCWRPIAALGAIGTGAGAVFGAGIDAMRSRAGPRVMFRVRF